MMNHHQTILAVDPDSDFLEWVERQLQNSKTRVLTATTSDVAFKIFQRDKPDLVLTESRLHPFSGLELLNKIRKEDPNATVILASAFVSTQAVIESMKMGAFDFLRKEQLPFNLKIVVDEALRAKADMRAAVSFQPQLTVEQHQDSIVGQSPAMEQVFKMIGRVAASTVPVMVTGESGTGKELVASAIHHYSPRSTRPFLAINCAAIPENLLESELFGHERGAFTGAANQRIGRFEQCAGGTLFLDEIGDMPLSLQGKLLRVLQDGEFSRVGGNTTIHADVRIVAATNKNLEKEVADRTFREDLFYRLNVVRVHLPPLRQRREDIRLLAEYFLSRLAARSHTPAVRLSEDAVQLLESHPWPGNVREMQNTIERAVILANTDFLLPKDIPLGPGTDTHPAMVSAGEEISVRQAIEVLLKAAAENKDVPLLPWLEEEFTRHAMRVTGGNQVRSAKLLGITRATLRKRLERFGVEKAAS